MANKTRAELRAQWIDGKRMTENTSVGAAVAFDDVWDSHFNLGEDGLQEVYEGGGTLVLNGTVGALLVSGDQDITLSSTDGGDILSISLDQTANTITTSVTDGASTTTVATTASTLDATNVAGTATIEFDDTTIKGTTNLDLVSNNPVEVKDTGGAAQRIKGATPVDVDDLATKDYVDSTILPGTGDVVSEAPPGSQATKVAIYSNLIADKFHIRETPATIDPTSGALLTAGDITSTAGNITSTAGNIISTVGNVEAGADVISTSNMTVGNNLDLSATDTIVSSTGSIDIKTLPDHIADTINPHATSIANIGSGTRAQLEAAVTDVTTFVAASDVAGGDLSGTYPTPVVSAITPASSFSCTLASIPANTYLFRNGSNEIIGTAGISGLPTGAAGGDLGGTYPNPEVVDLTISGEAGGSLLYYNGVIWVQLSNGSAGEVLQSGGGVAAPTWQPAAGGGNVSSAVGPVGTELAVFNSIGTSIIKSTTPLVVNLATGAINDVEIIDGHITLKDNTGFEPAYEEGRIYYANGAFNAYIDEADITLQIGQEFWVKVKNGIIGPTADITNGQAVYIDGSDVPTGLPKVLLADASSAVANRVLGLATHDIVAGGVGYITTSGIVRGLDTSGTGIAGTPSDGATVYLSELTPGMLTTVEPVAPNFPVVVGTIIEETVAPDGTLYVDITETMKTNDIGGTGGFKINSGALVAGQILEYNAGGFFENVAGGGGGGASVNTGNVYYVDSVYGNDGTAVPEDASFPFLTIGGAISGDGARVAALASGDQILVSPGTYPEDNLSLPDNTALESMGGWGQTIIGTIGSMNDIVSIGLDCYIDGFTVMVPTGGATAIDLNNTGGTNGVYNINLNGDSGTGTGIGIYRSSGGKTIGGNIRVERGGIGTCFKVDQGVLALDSCHVPQSNGDIINVVHVTTKAGPSAGRGQFVGFNVGNSNVESAIRIDGGTGTTLFVDKPFVIVYTPNIFNCDNVITADSKYLEVNLIGGRLDNITNAVVQLTDLSPTQAEAEAAIYRISSNHIPQYIFGTNSAIYSDFSLAFSQESTATLDSQFNIFGADKFSVGFPERSTQAHLGHGAPYTTGMVVLKATGAAGGTPDGVGFVDISSDAANKAGSTFTFPSSVASAANDVIYFGSRRSDVAGALRHWGLQLLIENAETGTNRGVYIWEIYNGGAWVECGVQATSLNEGYSYGNDLFWRSDSEEIIRYGIDANTVWSPYDVNSITSYWVRVRVVTPPSGGTPALPIFQRSKLAESSFSVSPLGVPYATGLGMLRKIISLNGNIWTSDGNLADYSKTVGAANSWTHKMKDSVLDGVGKAVMLQFPIPLGTCTAFPLKIYLEYEIINAPGGAISSPTSQLDIYSLPIQTSGNNVADPAGGLVPVLRTLANTETTTANDAQLISGLEMLPEGASAGDAFSTVTDKVNSILLCEIDISDYYEEDIIAIRFQAASLEGTSDIAVWSLIAEGVAHKDGKGIGI